ncbi:uncharacterized protein LOC135341740 isoform X2 [Halichondria panicea]|uniref:uncharacterized protein LOC135341740 isoform X2 n=1 Tax=Halichondria panicea TaxID=6063 RepID=UPI00312B5C83
MEILALKLFFVICLSRVELSTQVVPEVLDGPVTQTVPVTQYEAQFTCRARASAVFWYINGETLFNNIPSWIILYDDIHDFPNVEVTRRIGVRTQGRNRTKIECLATGSDQATVRSEPPVFLYIVDVLNAPVTELVTVNTTALRVSWFEPFAHTGFPILNYTLIIRSTADHSAPLYNASLSALEYVLTTDSVHRDCHNITFEVIATNSIGPSAAGVAIGGFPIFLGDFLLPPVVVITFTADLTPIINVIFKPPTVCWFQDASYELRILDVSTQALSLSTRIGSYRGGGIATISEAYNDIYTIPSILLLVTRQNRGNRWGSDSTTAAIYGGAVGVILVLVCLIGICLIALLLLRKKLSSEEQIAAPLYEEVGLSGNDIQLEPNDAYGKAVRCSKGIQVQSNQAYELDALNYNLIKGCGILTRRRKS